MCFLKSATSSLPKNSVPLSVWIFLGIWLGSLNKSLKQFVTPFTVLFLSGYNQILFVKQSIINNRRFSSWICYNFFLLSRVIHECYHSILSTVYRTLMHAMVTEGSFKFLVEFLCNLRFLKLPVDGIMTSLVHLTSDDFDLPTPWPSTICGVKNFRSTSKWWFNGTASLIKLLMATWFSIVTTSMNVFQCQYLS